MRRTILILALLLAAVATASAQNLAAFKAHLARPERGAAVTVREYGDAGDVAMRLSAAVADRPFEGWRVGLYFGNGPQAREEGRRVVRDFEEAFPRIPVEMKYENPYFKVTAGYCATDEEAIILLERVRPLFAKAFLVRSTLTAADLVREAEAGSGPETGTEGDSGAAADHERRQ